MAKTNGEILHHIHLIRMRVTGSGNLKMRLLSLDAVNAQSLVAFPLAATTNREPTRLCNFTEQRTQLEIKTTEINERFKISKILIFVKPVATEFPG